MNWYVIFYLFSLADKISNSTLTLSIITSIVAGISLISWLWTGLSDETMDTAPISRKCFFIFAPIAIFIWMIWVSVPNRNDMLVIIAGGAVGEFVTNDTNALEIPSDITRFLRKEILEATMSDGNEALKNAMGIKSEKEKLMDLSKEKLIEMIQSKDSL